MMMRDFALEVHFSRWEFAARHNLAGSDAESMSVQELLDIATPEERADFSNLRLSYTESFGATALRRAIAQSYGSVSPEEVLCCAGAEEALFIAMSVLLSAEDHAIVVTPNYQATETVPLERCAVSGVALRADKGWQLDLDEIVDACRPNTKLLAINFPNNPTGAVLSEDQLTEIIAFCRLRGIWLFSDEVYRGLERAPATTLPQAVDLYERAISLNVMSKSLGLPGLRIGWLAAHDSTFLSACERRKHYLSICNSAPSEVLSLVALRNRDRILARNRRITEENLARLNEFFAARSDRFEWEAPPGGCIAFPRYLGAEGVDEFTEALVQEAGVLLLPARVFRSEVTTVPTDRFRIGFGRKSLPVGLSALAQWLERRTQ